VTELDLTGVPCPMNWVRARLALEELAAGERLDVLLDPGEPLDSVPRSAREVTLDGNRVAIVKR
jgi:tRNA 2-thiouridine synthesizing protein A